MKTAGICLMLFFAGSALAGQDSRPIEIGSDGSVRFEPLEGEYTPTGLSATPEATKYPEAIGKLIGERLDFVSVKTKTVDTKMVGFLTWRVIEETELVLARQGDALVVRAPADEEERGWCVGKEVFNPFGLLVAVFFALLLLGNLMAGKNAIAAFFFAVTAFSFAFAAFASVAATAIAAFSFAVAAAAFATIVAAVVVAIAAFADDETMPYRRLLSGLSAGLMALVIWLVI